MEVNYPGLENYFPTDFKVDQSFRDILNQCRKVVDQLVPMEGAILDCIENNGYYSINFGQLRSVDEDLCRQLMENPLFISKFLSLAVNCAHSNHVEKENENAAPSQMVNNDDARIERRLWLELTGHSSTTPIGDIQPPHYNKFITLTGTVVAMEKICELIYETTFRCDNCSTLQSVLQPMGKFQAPRTCQSSICNPSSKLDSSGTNYRAKISFSKVKHSFISVPSQIIKIIQTRYDSKTNEKRVDSINIQLINHLVQQCLIMDSITVSGVIVEPKTIEGEGVVEFYMLASNIITNREEPIPSNIMRGINAITQEPDILSLVVASFCPAVPGNNMVKLGVLLSLVGGHDADNGEEENSIAFRGQVHTLLLGATNKDKKEILNAAHRIAPVSSYADKNYTQNLVFDVTSDRTNETLHSGPVLQANKGICCIDDLDTMKTQWNIISEIMDTQIFQVSKNSFSLTLPVDISVVATAVPVGGSYRNEKTLYENIKMPVDMLNQFDLIFHLVDEPDHNIDRNYTKKVLQNREGRCETSQPGTPSQASRAGQFKPLPKRLAAINIESLDLLPRKLLSKYLQFVRSKVFPVFNEEANEVLFKFYEEYQEKVYRINGTTSLFQSDNQFLATLMRLGIARARLESRAVVTDRDIKDVIELIKHTRPDIFPKDVITSFSRSQQFQARRSSEPTEGLGGLATKRCRSSNERFVRYLEDYFAEYPGREFTLEDLWAIARNGPPVAKFDQMIDYLNLQGYILQKGHNKYRWASRR